MINDDVIGYGPYSDAPTNQVNYTFKGGNGFSAMIGLEQGSDGDFGYSDEGLEKNYVIDDYLPDVVGGLKLEQAWGSISAVAGYDALDETWPARFALTWNSPKKFPDF